MKKCSTSLIIRELKMKTSVKYYLTLIIRMAINKDMKTNTNEDVENREPFHADRNVNFYSHNGKKVWSFLKKLKVEIPYDQEIPLLGIHLKGKKSLPKEIFAFPSSL